MACRHPPAVFPLDPHVCEQEFASPFFAGNQHVTLEDTVRDHDPRINAKLPLIITEGGLLHVYRPQTVLNIELFIAELASLQPTGDQEVIGQDAMEGIAIPTLDSFNPLVR